MKAETPRASRRTDDATHVYLLEGIPRDLYDAVVQKGRSEDPPAAFKHLIFRWMRKYAKKPLRRPRKGRNPLKLF